MLKELLTTHILFPTDFSQGNFKLLDELLNNGIDSDQLRVIHVLTKLSPVSPVAVWEITNEQTRINNAQKFFEQNCQHKLANNIHFDVVIGNNISQEIIKYSFKHNIGMIIMPSHKYKGFTHWLKGSITDKVVQNVPCPVLVLARDENQDNFDYSQTRKQLERIFYELS